MKDEIKKILDFWQFYINEQNNYKLLNVHFDEIKMVLDYITTLQEENNRLKEKENKLQKEFKDWKKEIEKEKKYYLCDRTNCCGRIKNSKKYSSIYHELKDYKSRNEKAIEYIKGWQSFPHTNGSTHNELRNLLNILQGDDNNE